MNEMGLKFYKIVIFTNQYKILEIRECWCKFETRNRVNNIEHKQIPKNILTDDEN